MATIYFCFDVIDIASHQFRNIAFQYAQIFCGMIPKLMFFLLSHFYLRHYKHLFGLLNIHQPCDQVNDPTVRYNL